MELGKVDFYLLLDNCSTHTFLSKQLINSIPFKKLSPLELVTGTFDGSVDYRYERVCVTLKNIKINACIKKFTLCLEGHSYVDLDVIQKLGFGKEKIDIRKHIPYNDVIIDGIIGTDSLPLILKDNWCFDPISNIVVGISCFGRFVFGSFNTSPSSQAMAPVSTSLAISCKNKNFQLSLELLINNYFEIDKTPYEQTRLTLNESNAEKLFLKHITYENNAYYISPLFNPLIPKEELSQYMN